MALDTPRPGLEILRSRSDYQLLVGSGQLDLGMVALSPAMSWADGHWVALLPG